MPGLSGAKEVWGIVVCSQSAAQNEKAESEEER